MPINDSLPNLRLIMPSAKRFDGIYRLSRLAGLKLDSAARKEDSPGSLTPLAFGVAFLLGLVTAGLVSAFNPNDFLTIRTPSDATSHKTGRTRALSMLSISGNPEQGQEVQGQLGEFLSSPLSGDVASQMQQLIDAAVPGTEDQQVWQDFVTRFHHPSDAVRLLLLVPNVEALDSQDLYRLEKLCRSSIQVCGVLFQNFHQMRLETNTFLPIGLATNSDLWPSMPNDIPRLLIFSSPSFVLWTSEPLPLNRALEISSVVGYTLRASWRITPVVDHPPINRVNVPVSSLASLQSRVRGLDNATEMPLGDTWIARQGKPVFINLWGTWCKPCVKELPALSELSRQFYGQVVFVGIAHEMSLDDPVNKVKEFLESFDIKYAQYISPDMNVHREIIREGSEFPGFAIYDAEGNLRLKFTGGLLSKGRLALVERSLTYLLSESGRAPQSPSDAPPSRRAEASEKGGGALEKGGGALYGCRNQILNNLRDSAQLLKADLLVETAVRDLSSELQVLSQHLAEEPRTTLLPLAYESVEKDFSQEVFRRHIRDLVTMATKVPAINVPPDDGRRPGSFLLFFDPDCGTCIEVLDMIQSLRSVCPSLAQEIQVLPVAGHSDQSFSLAAELELIRRGKPDFYKNELGDIMTEYHFGDPSLASTNLRAAMEDLPSDLRRSAESAVRDRRAALPGSLPGVVAGGKFFHRSASWGAYDPLGSISALVTALAIGHPGESQGSVSKGDAHD